MIESILENPLIYNPQVSYMMDLFMAYKIFQKIDKKKDKPIYKSPKRDHVCGTCGQQDTWCVCTK